VPVLLNTSFNVQEPIVCTPADAIRTYVATNFEVLVLENHVVVRNESGSSSPAGT
jgi:carbamoyltransferase